MRSKKEILEEVTQFFQKEDSSLELCLDEYLGASPRVGLRRATALLEMAPSVASMWGPYPSYEQRASHIAVANVLTAIFITLSEGVEDFPPFPGSVDPACAHLWLHSSINVWARNLISDHVHEWRICRHTPETRLVPSQLNCEAAPIEYAFLSHQVCRECGVDKHNYSQILARAQAILELPESLV